MGFAEFFGEPVHVYTRKQAIDDGMLVPAGGAAAEAGFRCPVTLTRAVWDRYVELPEEIACQDETGRLWDILWMLKHQLRSCAKGIRFVGRFSLFVAMPTAGVMLANERPSGEGNMLREVELLAVSTMEYGLPAITVMLPDES